MRQGLVPLAVLLAACGVRAPESRCPTDESMDFADTGLTAEPARFGLAEEDLYLGVVAKVFDAETADLGGGLQILSSVAMKPEEVVYIDTFLLGSDEPSRLIHLVAAESIHDKLRDVGLLEASRVRVRRTEVKLSLPDSQLLSEVWENMVEQAETGQPYVVRMIESRSDHFVRACNAGCLGAVAVSPHKGTLGADLVALGQLLAEVADASADRRADVLRRARAAAGALAQRVRGRKPRVRRLYRWEDVMRRNAAGAKDGVRSRPSSPGAPAGGPP